PRLTNAPPPFQEHRLQLIAFASTRHKCTPRAAASPRGANLRTALPLENLCAIPHEGDARLHGEGRTAAASRRPCSCPGLPWRATMRSYGRPTHQARRDTISRQVPQTVSEELDDLDDSKRREFRNQNSRAIAGLLVPRLLIVSGP